MKLKTYSIFYRGKRKSQIFETSVAASNKKEATEYAKEDLKGYTITRISWDRIDMFFSDIDCIYHGNIYKNGRIIGDYFCSDSTILEKIFPQLIFNWG